MHQHARQRGKEREGATAGGRVYGTSLHGLFELADAIKAHLDLSVIAALIAEARDSEVVGA